MWPSVDGPGMFGEYKVKVNGINKLYIYSVRIVFLAFILEKSLGYDILIY